MAGAAALPQARDQAGKRRRPLDFAAFDRLGYARQVLHNQTPGADIEMPDLGIAHLPRRQADVLARCVQEGVRTTGPQAVEIGGAGLAHGIVGILVAPAPAVENCQHHWTPLLYIHVLCSSSPSTKATARTDGVDQ